MNELDRNIMIDSYLSGKLSVQELELFNKKMADDDFFRQEVERVKLVNEVIKIGAQADIKNQLQKMHDHHLKVKTRNKWVLVGVILLLVMASILLFNYSQQKSEVDMLIQPHNSEEIIDDNSNSSLTIDNHQENHKAEASSSNSNVENQLGIKEIEEDINTDSSTVNLLETEAKNKNIDTTIIEQENKLVATKEHEQTILNNENDSELNDPCKGIKDMVLTYDLKLPSLGYEQGTFELLTYPGDDIYFTEYSMDGGKSYNSSSKTKTVNSGIYELIAKDENGCITKTKKLNVKYRNHNFVIQPSYGKYWKLDLSEYIEMPVHLEIRNARTAQLVYQKEINPNDNFIWEGKDLNNTTLPLGNYVYIFKSDEKGLIAQGQIAVIN